jgi:hypothetical protein
MFHVLQSTYRPCGEKGVLDSGKGRGWISSVFEDKSTRGAISIERSVRGRGKGLVGGMVSVPFTLTKVRCRERKDDNVRGSCGCIERSLCHIV